MLFVGTSIIHPSTEGVFLLCNILDLLIYRLLFAICMIWFIGKFFIFGVKASWGILKLLCTVVFFPVILIGMVVGGLIYIAFPLLIIGGIIALISSNS